MTPNRKRGRDSQEDEVEFTPLSKRINNLHINNTLLGSGILNEWGPGPPYASANNNSSNLLDSPPLSVQSVDLMYNPELSESENPHYFNSNKLLYEMYLARQQRQQQL